MLIFIVATRFDIRQKEITHIPKRRNAVENGDGSSKIVVMKLIIANLTAEEEKVVRDWTEQELNISWKQAVSEMGGIPVRMQISSELFALNVAAACYEVDLKTMLELMKQDL